MKKPRKSRAKVPIMVPAVEGPAEPLAFTPGPWKAIFTGWGYSVIVGPDDAPGREPIASITRYGLLQRHIEPNYPNVRLIVRSPDRFEVAVRAVAILEAIDAGGRERVGDFLTETKALIAQIRDVETPFIDRAQDGAAPMPDPGDDATRGPPCSASTRRSKPDHRSENFRVDPKVWLRTAGRPSHRPGTLH